MKKLIRPRKDGGYSECSSPDNLVGKGRCCHILTDETPMEITKIQRGLYQVNIAEDSKLTINAQKKAIIDFFNNLPKISEEKQKKIIEYLEEENSSNEV